MKIAIALPSRGNIKTITTVSLMKLFYQMFLDGYNPEIIFTFGRVETGRNQAVEKAQAKDCTHILFIDSDMEFPPYSCKMLVEADKDIIGCNAAMKKTGTPVIVADLEGKELSYINDDIKSVDFIGMAVTLIKMEVFEKMQKPWFYAKPKPGYANVFSEDVTFCRDARFGYGYTINCHLRLSMEIGHVDGRERVVTLEPYIRKQMEGYKK
jgi:hypothetical protein